MLFSGSSLTKQLRRHLVKAHPPLCSHSNETPMSQKQLETLASHPDHGTRCRTKQPDPETQHEQGHMSCGSAATISEECKSSSPQWAKIYRTLFPGAKYVPTQSKQTHVPLF